MKYLKKILITLLILAVFNIVLFSAIFPVAIAAENEKENDIKIENNVDYNAQEDEDYENYSEAYKRYLALSEEEKAKVYVIPDKYDVSIEDFERVYGKKQTNYNTGLSPKFARATTIPTTFNLKDGNDFGIENQGSEGLCWAFASLGSLRTHLALKNGENYDLSEWHMNYLTSKWYSKYKFDSIPYRRELGDGGNFIDALGYYKYNNGPVLEEDCPYQSTTSTDQETLDRLDNLKPDIYVHQTIRFPTVSKVRQSDGTVKVYNGASSFSPEMTGEEVTEIRNRIKQHIMENGGVKASINASYRYKRYNIYNPDNWKAGHAITIIGWDDNYSKDNFKSKDSNGNDVTPTQDGAYLIMNSWGDDWGNNGLGWVSYEDLTIEQVVYGYLSADTTPNYVTYTFSNTSSYNKMKEQIIRQFTKNQAEYSEKEQILIDNEVIKLEPDQNKIQVLDIVINEMTSLDMSNCNLTQRDFETIANASKAKYPKLETLNFSDNHIYLVSNSILSKFKARKTLHFENQTFTVTSKADGTQTYRNIITQSKNSSSEFYSSSGLTFTGCTENSDGKGVTLTQDTATVKINSGKAAGTIMTIKRKNVTKPTVTITSNAGENGGTTNSNNITYFFTWNESVTGFTSSDIVIRNSDGTTATKGAWQEVSTGTRWILVVQNSGSCTQTVSVPADVCTSSATNASNDESEEFNINIDRTAPQVIITADKTSPTSADTVIYTLQWSEDVEDFNVNEDVTITNGIKLAVAYNNNNGDGKYVIVVRNSGTCTQTVSVDANVCTDIVGNGNTAASKTIRIDRTGPMLNFIKVVSPNAGTYTEGQEINIYVSFNEYIYGEKNAVKMTSTTAPKLKIKFGAGEEKEAEFYEAQFSLVKYKYIISQGDNGKLETTSFTGKVYDSVGNETNVSNRTLDGNEIIADTTPPTVIITTNPTAETTNASSITYTFTWSENVEGFTVEDVTVTNGTKGTSSRDGNTYTLVVTNSGSCTQTVKVEANKCTDTAENGNAASETITRTIDRTAPELESIKVKSPDSGTYRTGEDITIVATYSENIYKNASKEAVVAETTALKLKFGTGEERSATFSNVSGKTITYTYKIQTGDRGLLAITGYTGTVYDEVGNSKELSKLDNTGNEITADTTPLDTTPPTVIITTNPTAETTNASSITYTFTWSENVEGFTVEDVTVTNGTKGTSSKDGNTYTLVVTNSGSCTQTVKVEANKCTDTAGNGNAASETITRTIDRTAPELESIKVKSPDSGTYRTGEDITIVAEYSENIYKNASKEAVAAETTALKLKFGTGEEKSATFSNVSGKTITYTYKIQTGDRGLLAITGYTGTVYDTVGNGKELSKLDNTGNAITAMTYKKGDIDGNGPVNLMDLLKLRRHIANQKRTQKITEWELSEEEQARADVHEDGKGEINLMDVLVLRRYIAASKSETVKQNHPSWYWED